MTSQQLAAPLLRLTLGVVSGFHALRFLGAFTDETAQHGVGDLANKIGSAGLEAPSVFAWVAVILMALAAIGLVLGAFTRVAASFFFAVCVLGLVIRPPLWEVNAVADVDRLGIELLLVLMVQCVAVFSLGPGGFSVDLSRSRSAASHGA